jgi:L-amino acid N-acyltransferase YncA
MLVRDGDATSTDAAACAAIYAPYVRDTAISFEEEPPTEADMRRRIEQAQSHSAWLVLEEHGRVVGYAYAGPFSGRAAYRWSCEVSVYLELGRRRSGAGRALYEALLARLADLGFRMAAAGMTLPNPASEQFHRAMGFQVVGVFRRIGFKHGRWHDVAWTQRPLLAGAGELTPPS